MTTRSRQKLSSILAVCSIIALLLLLVFVWTAVRNGVFSNANEMNAHGSYRLKPINPNDVTTTTSTSTSIGENSTHHHLHGHHSHHQHHRHNESTTLLGKLQTHSLFSHFIPWHFFSESRKLVSIKKQCAFFWFAIHVHCMCVRQQRFMCATFFLYCNWSWIGLI